MKQRLWAVCFGVASVVATHAVAADAPSTDFLKVSLKDLADIEVTSVSRKREKASEAAAAIYVITQEDIRRSGATNMAEILRLAPGVQVARSGSSQWAVSTRGFNDQFANKLLVLIDGRTVYSPTFSGVWWDIHNPMHEDIERIEVIRGPGASVWGANAVNGVINIITKSAKDTQGTVAIVGGGTDKQLGLEGRHGFQLSDNAWARVYASHETYGESKRQGGELGNNDAWDIKRAGFRSDWEASPTANATLQGDIYQGREDQRYQFPTTAAPYSSTVFDNHEVMGMNILGRWDKQLNERSDLTLQSYLDYNSRDIIVHDNKELTFDFDMQHVYQATDRYTLTWGAGYRLIDDNLSRSFALSYDPDTRRRQLFSGFFDHKFALIPDEVFLSLGSKFEYNDFTQFEQQPSARLSWVIDDSQTLWGAVSHAVRTPDRSNDDIINPLRASAGSRGLTNVLVRRGSEQTTSERLNAYEVGYRIQPTDDIAIDSSVFYNDYSNLIINRLGTPHLVSSGFSSPYVEVPLFLVNGGKGHSYGGEIVANWQATPIWNLEASYSYLDITLKDGTSSVNTEDKSPQHQVGLRSRLDLPYHLECDQMLSYVDEVSTNTSAKIDDYVRLDLRLGYQPLDGVELSVVGQNLLDHSHQEFGPFLYNSQAEIGRSAYAQMVVRF